MDAVPLKTLAASLLALCLACGLARAAERPVEIHDRIASTITDDRQLALTLDACSVVRLDQVALQPVR